MGIIFPERMSNVFTTVLLVSEISSTTPGGASTVIVKAFNPNPLIISTGNFNVKVSL